MNKMKKVVMYKGYSYDFGPHWHWHAEQEWPDWDPYEVWIPEDFHLGESKSGSKLYFCGDDPVGYELHINKDSEGGRPLLVGGSEPKYLALDVVGPVRKEESK